MHQRRIQASGRPEEVLTSGILHDVFGLGGIVGEHPSKGKPLITSFPVNRVRLLQRRTRAMATDQVPSIFKLQTLRTQMMLE